MPILKNNAALTTLIALIAGIIFIPFIGNCPLFDWDEINFAECAREMIVSGNYSQVQLNYLPFWEKPPVFIWLQAASMNIFGINEFAARLPNALCSIVSLITLFHIGRKIHSNKFGLLWCLIYVSTILPHLFFRSGIIDPWFNLLIFISIYNIILFVNNSSGKKEVLNALLAGFFLGLAVLTKGPAALVIVALTVLAVAILSRNLKQFLSKPFMVFAATTLFVSLSWFLFELMRGNGKVIEEFITYQVRLFETGDSGHDGPFFYHMVVLLLGCFPASFLFIAGYRKKEELTPFQLLCRRFMLCLFWVVLILFSVVKTKIVHYSSLCYFPLTFIATLALVHFFEKIKFGFTIKWFYWMIAIIVSVLVILIGFIDSFKSALINGTLVDDEFARGNLEANVHWSGFESFLGIIFLAASMLIFIGINKKKLTLVYYGFVANLAFIYFSINIIVPKVEQYTQHAAIEFYKACSRHDCYVETHGFKSYAYLFYSERKPSHYANHEQKKSVKEKLDQMEADGHSRFTSFPLAYGAWLKTGKIDKPAFIISKTKDEKELEIYPELRKLYDENGYSFFVRMPEGTAR
ncbi:MAG: glycosyltransferase family 39 protein [Bacteroidetes bacterium]|nr:glycosyltransferase family 39 protein [Bacteroidota bacterium]